MKDRMEQAIQQFDDAIDVFCEYFDVANTPYQYMIEILTKHQWSCNEYDEVRYCAEDKDFSDEENHYGGEIYRECRWEKEDYTMLVVEDNGNKYCQIFKNSLKREPFDWY